MSPGDRFSKGDPAWIFDDLFFLCLDFMVSPKTWRIPPNLDLPKASSVHREESPNGVWHRHSDCGNHQMPISPMPDSEGSQKGWFKI
jgi:hypothetical protein